MRQTWKEVQVSKCIRFGNKYRFLKPLMIVIIVFVVAIDRIRIGIISNRKKLLGVGISFLVFLVSNSFSTPAFQYQSIIGYEEQAEIEQEEISLENQEVYYTEDIDLEEDILAEEESLYSVDEILKNSQISDFMKSDVSPLEGQVFSKDDWNLLNICSKC